MSTPHAPSRADAVDAVEKSKLGDTTVIMQTLGDTTVHLSEISQPSENLLIT